LHYKIKDVHVDLRNAILVLKGQNSNSDDVKDIL